MGLWEKGKFSIPIPAIIELEKKVRENYECCDILTITDIVMMDKDHPDNVWARSVNYPEHFAMIEIQYDVAGHCTAAGIRIEGEIGNGGKYIFDCFYD